jgi:hypothetical protein
LHCATLIGVRCISVVRRRFQAIEPLLKAGKSAPEAIAVRAAEVGKDRSTLYRWLSTYVHGGTLASLLPAKFGAATGQKRLENDVELVIAAAIESVFEKFHTGASRLSMSRVAAISSRVSEVCTWYS